jgi:VWFA-related protein
MGLRKSASATGAALVAVAIGLGTLDARQTARPAATQAGQAPSFRSGTELTFVRFLVIRSNRYVGGLTAADIQLLDNGIERSFDLFEGGCTAPVRSVPAQMALLFDISSSVSLETFEWIAARDALVRAVGDVPTSVYGFHWDRHRYCRLTSDPAELRDAIQRLVQTPRNRAPGADTIPIGKGDNESPVYGGVLAAAWDLAANEARPVLIVVSDGQSGDRLSEVIGEIQTLGVTVFPVNVRSLQPEAKTGWELNLREFARLGELTGGRSFEPYALNPESVREILGIVAETLRCEYVVGFVAEGTGGEPSRHDLEVKLRTRAAGALRGGRRTVRY